MNDFITFLGFVMLAVGLYLIDLKVMLVGIGALLLLAGLIGTYRKPESESLGGLEK